MRCTKAKWPDKAVCEVCGRIESRGQFRTICQSCEREAWFAKHADRIEIYMSIGMTFSMACVKVRLDNRPICLSCGYKIRGGTKGRHFFCRTTPQCKSAYIKFKNYKSKNGLSKEEALSRTLGWLDERRKEQRVA